MRKKKKSEKSHHRYYYCQYRIYCTHKRLLLSFSRAQNIPIYIYKISNIWIYICINVGAPCRQVVTGGYVQVRSPSRLSAARTSVYTAYIYYKQWMCVSTFWANGTATVSGWIRRTRKTPVKRYKILYTIVTILLLLYNIFMYGIDDSLTALLYYNDITIAWMVYVGL